MKFPTFDLTGKVAMVTGATKGIGYGYSLGLANAGADIVVVSRTPADCDRVVEEIRAMGRDAIAVPTDVTDPSAIKEMVRKAVDKFGKIDILVNNAGSAVTTKAEDLDMADWDRVVDIDLRAHFMVSQEVGKVMIRQKYGKIINTLSVYAFVGGKRVIPYLAAKGGLAQVTKGLAMEWAKYNINVNGIVPGYVVTPINEKNLKIKRFMTALSVRFR